VSTTVVAIQLEFWHGIHIRGEQVAYCWNLITFVEAKSSGTQMVCKQALEEYTHCKKTGDCYLSCS